MRFNRARIEFDENVRKGFFHATSQQDMNALWSVPSNFIPSLVRRDPRLILSFTIDEVATSDVTPRSKSSLLADEASFLTLWDLVFEIKSWLLIVFTRQEKGTE